MQHQLRNFLIIRPRSGYQWQVSFFFWQDQLCSKQSWVVGNSGESTMAFPLAFQSILTFSHLTSFLKNIWLHILWKSNHSNSQDSSRDRINAPDWWQDSWQHPLFELVFLEENLRAACLIWEDSGDVSVSRCFAIAHGEKITIGNWKIASITTVPYVCMCVWCTECEYVIRCNTYNEANTIHLYGLSSWFKNNN